MSRPTDMPSPHEGPPDRARLILDFEENGERTHAVEKGWARITGDGAWVLWLGDTNECWQSWPREHVLCIDWEIAHA